MLRRIFPGIWNFRPIISLATVLKNFQELGNQFFKYFQATVPFEMPNQGSSFHTRIATS